MTSSPRFVILDYRFDEERCLSYLKQTAYQPGSDIGETTEHWSHRWSSSGFVSRDVTIGMTLEEILTSENPLIRDTGLQIIALEQKKASHGT